MYGVGAREKAREQTGTDTLQVGDDETDWYFFDDVETRIRKLQNDSLSSSPAKLQLDSVEVDQLVQEVLRPAALDAIRIREGQDRSVDAM